MLFFFKKKITPYEFLFMFKGLQNCSNQIFSLEFGVRSYSRYILIGTWMVEEFVSNWNLRIKRPF